MKLSRRFIAAGTLALSLAVVSIPAFASQLNGEKSIEDLAQVKEERLQAKQDQLKQLVEAGKITQEDADYILAMLQERQLTCDGSRSNSMCGLGRQNCSVNQNSNSCGLRNAQRGCQGGIRIFRSCNSGCGIEQ